MKENPQVYNTKIDNPLTDKIKELITFSGKDPGVFESELAGEIIYSSFKVTVQIPLLRRDI